MSFTLLTANHTQKECIEIASRKRTVTELGKVWSTLRGEVK